MVRLATTDTAVPVRTATRGPAMRTKTPLRAKPKAASKAKITGSLRHMIVIRHEALNKL